MKKKTNLLELIHSDVCDSNDVLTHGGKRYFITFIDDFSKYCYVYLINPKHEYFKKFKIYKSEVENQLERTIKILRYDRGGEYTSLEMNVFCETRGIIHEITPLYSSQSNGVAERKNRTLLDMVNVIVSHLAGSASISTHITLDRHLCRSRLGDWCTTPSQLNKNNDKMITITKHSSNRSRLVHPAKTSNLHV